MKRLTIDILPDLVTRTRDIELTKRLADVVGTNLDETTQPGSQRPFELGDGFRGTDRPGGVALRVQHTSPNDAATALTS